MLEHSVFMWNPCLMIQTTELKWPTVYTRSQSDQILSIQLSVVFAFRHVDDLNSAVRIFLIYDTFQIEPTDVNYSIHKISDYQCSKIQTTKNSWPHIVMCILCVRIKFQVRDHIYVSLSHLIWPQSSTPSQIIQAGDTVKLFKFAISCGFTCI